MYTIFLIVVQNLTKIGVVNYVSNKNAHGRGQTADDRQQTVNKQTETRDLLSYPRSHTTSGENMKVVSHLTGLDCNTFLAYAAELKIFNN